MTYNIATGGQNAFPPLHRNGNYNEGCNDVPDPNAPIVYFWGMGLAWEGGELTSIYGDDFPPIAEEENDFLQILDENVHVWAPFVDLEIMKISSAIMAGVAQGFRVDGVPAIVAPAAILLSGDELMDGADHEVGHALMTPYLVADTIHGVAVLSDGTTTTYTAAKLDEEQLEHSEGFTPFRVVTFDSALEARTVVSMTIDESAGIDAMRVFIGDLAEDDGGEE